MDGYLPDPRDSVVFSPDFLGETDPDGMLVRGSAQVVMTLA